MIRLVRYSEDDVYVVPAASVMEERKDVSCRFKLLSDMSSPEWRQVEALQGKLATRYLRVRYRSPETQIIHLVENGAPISILWLVPTQAIRSQYPFVMPDCAAIIACSTRADSRGRGLYPYGIARIAASGLSKRYYIWAHKNNKSSLRGIQKAGGILVGSFVRKRWLRGIFSTIEFTTVAADD